MKHKLMRTVPHARCASQVLFYHTSISSELYHGFTRNGSGSDL